METAGAERTTVAAPTARGRYSAAAVAPAAAKATRWPTTSAASAKRKPKGRAAPSPARATESPSIECRPWAKPPSESPACATQVPFETRWSTNRMWYRASSGPSGGAPTDRSAGARAAANSAQPAPAAKVHGAGGAVDGPRLAASRPAAARPPASSTAAGPGLNQPPRPSSSAQTCTTAHPSPAASRAALAGSASRGASRRRSGLPIPQAAIHQASGTAKSSPVVRSQPNARCVGRAPPGRAASTQSPQTTTTARRTRPLIVLLRPAARRARRPRRGRRALLGTRSRGGRPRRRASSAGDTTRASPRVRGPGAAPRSCARSAAG